MTVKYTVSYKLFHLQALHKKKWYCHLVQSSLSLSFSFCLSSKFYTAPSHLSLGKWLQASLWPMVDAQMTGCQSDLWVTIVIAQTSLSPWQTGDVCKSPRWDWLRESDRERDRERQKIKALSRVFLLFFGLLLEPLLVVPQGTVAHIPILSAHIRTHAGIHKHSFRVRQVNIGRSEPWEAL